MTGSVLDMDLPTPPAPSARSGSPTALLDGHRDTPGHTFHVLVVDPEQVTRELTRRALAAIGIQRISAAGTLGETTALLDSTDCGDLAVVSMQFGRQTADIIAIVRSHGWHRVLAIAPMAEIGPVIDAVAAGSTGIVVARRSHPAGGPVPHAVHDLSSREIEVLKLVADGRSNKWIGDTLELSALTVKSHLARIGRKLGTGDRAHMVALAMRAGVIR